MFGKVLTSCLVPFDYLYRHIEFGQHFSKKKSCFSSSDDHHFLKIGIFSFFMDLRVELHDRFSFSYDIKLIFREYFTVAVRYDDFSISGNSNDQHIGKYSWCLMYFRVYQFRYFRCLCFEKRGLACSEYTVAKGVFFYKVFIYFESYCHVRIDDIIYRHSIPDKVKLIHVFRIPDTRYYFGTSKFLCKWRYYDILFITVGCGKQKIIWGDMKLFKDWYFFSVRTYCHYIHLHGQFMQRFLILIDNSYGVVSSEQCICYTCTEFTCSDNCDFHFFSAGLKDRPSSLHQ